MWGFAALAPIMYVRTYVHTCTLTYHVYREVTNWLLCTTYVSMYVVQSRISLCARWHCAKCRANESLQDYWDTTG